MGGDMDGHLILTGTREQVISDLSVINRIAAHYWQSDGEAVIDGKLYAKDEYGQPLLSGQPTTTWDMPRQSASGEWWIFSPTDDDRFHDWRASLNEGALQCTEMPMPEYWNIVQDA